MGDRGWFSVSFWYLKMGKTKRFTVIMLAVLALCLAAGCGKKESEGITSLEQLNDASRIIGVSSDTSEDQLVARELPNAQIVYVKDAVSAYAAVSQGKMDAFVYDKLQMEAALYGGQQGVRLLDVTLGEGNQVAVGLSPVTKIPDLKEKIDTFIEEIQADGTLADMNERWVVKRDDTMPEISVPEKASTHLIVGTTGSAMPFTYYKDMKLTGRDIELARRFAAWLGAELEFKVYDYDGITAAAVSGDVDCIMADLFVTEERKEAIPFSEVLTVNKVSVMVRDTGSTSAAEPEITGFSDLNGKTVSMLTGVPFEDLVRSKVPDVGGFTYYNNMPDMYLALKSGKTDAVLSNNAVGTLGVNRNPELKLLPESLQDGVFGFAFAKGDPRREEWQAAYEAISEGTKQELWEKWTGSDDSIKYLPEQDWPGANGTVKVASVDTLEPMSYAGEEGLKGFDIEMILLMAKELDVHVEFTGMEFSAVLAAVQSGKAQIGAGSIIVTEERQQAVDFVEYYPAAFVLLVRGAQEDTDSGGFWSSIVTSFEKTFIREDRWKMFLQGICTTLLITVLSILLGTILGFFTFMLCRNGNRAANLITRICIRLVQGMPAVVLLMILYYIIFAKMNISGTAVSIVAFTLIFGAGVFGLIKSGVGAIDIGQTEAAYALGYTDRRAFYRVVLPQALPHFMPAYKTSITEIIKATAIVGYVAVMDLTKIGDLVRSRTYDAFFPLIAVAAFYFLLAAILISIVKSIELKIDPKQRKPEDILKGVQTK